MKFLSSEANDLPRKIKTYPLKDRLEVIKKAFDNVHKTTAEIPGNAFELWEDGEITMTKCANGRLYGIRTLHSIETLPGESLPVTLFPCIQPNGHAFVRVDNIAVARALWETAQELL